MSDQSDTSPPERKPKRRRRVLVWSMIVVASVLLVFSITANWVQRAVLDSDEVANTSDEILSDPDVQEALSIYLVDQLYANVDVTGEIEEKLPDNAKALAAPVAAATRQLALNVSEKALASPRVQALVVRSIRESHGQFVRLIDDEGAVRLDHRRRRDAPVRRRHRRPGRPPRGGSGDDLQDPERRAGPLDGPEAALDHGSDPDQDGARRPRRRAGGHPAPGAGTESRGAPDEHRGSCRATIAGLDTKLETVQDKAPAQLQDRLTNLDERLSDLDGRLTAVADRTTAVLEDPAQANVEGLDAALASAEARVTDALDRQALQNPGQLVVMKSDQLNGVQTLVGALRNLGFVLPLLVLFLYVGAIYLAQGWRRRALIAAGGGILAATLLVLLTRRLLGGAVVDSVAGSETVKPAIQSVWDIVSGTLRERALFALVIGVAFVAAGLLAGPGPLRSRRTPRPRAAPARPPGRGLLRRRRAVPTLADHHARDQQPRTGPGDRAARRAGRGGHRSAAPPDGAGVSAASKQSLIDAAAMAGDDSPSPTGDDT